MMASYHCQSSERIEKATTKKPSSALISEKQVICSSGGDQRSKKWRPLLWQEQNIHVRKGKIAVILAIFRGRKTTVICDNTFMQANKAVSRYMSCMKSPDKALV